MFDSPAQWVLGWLLVEIALHLLPTTSVPVAEKSVHSSVQEGDGTAVQRSPVVAAYCLEIASPAGPGRPFGVAEPADQKCFRHCLLVWIRSAAFVSTATNLQIVADGQRGNGQSPLGQCPTGCPASLQGDRTAVQRVEAHRICLGDHGTTR